MALLIAGWLGLRSEMVIAQSVARLQRQAVSLRSERPSPEPDPDLPADKPPRALLADALFIAQQHATAPAPTRRPALIAAFCAYFAWVGWFDVLIVRERTFAVAEWAGLATLVLGGLLAASIVRASPPADPSAPG